ETYPRALHDALPICEATSRVRIAGRAEPIEVTDRGFIRAGAANPLALAHIRLFSILEMIYGNPFEEARADSIEIDLRLSFERCTDRKSTRLSSSHVQ